ncbi:Pau18p, partial [Saccharomyces cerevisiae YJM1615]
MVKLTSIAAGVAAIAA